MCQRLCLSLWCLVLLFLLAASLPTSAQERRVALVIGNDDYVAEARLRNAVRDAELVARSFESIGFRVTRQRNLNQRRLLEALQRFETEADGADIAAIYFAGHGIGDGSQNWLLPVDAQPRSARHLADDAVPHTRFVSSVEGATGLQLVILDACRNNPFVRRLAGTPGARSIPDRGLSPIAERDLPPNRVVAFSARDGQTASDGPDGGNSPFSQALGKRLIEPGVEIGLLCRLVRDDVARVTRRAQEPWTYSNLSGQQFYLARATRPDQATSPPARVEPQSPLSLELEFWRSVQAAPTCASHRAYLQQFPQGAFAALARSREAELCPAPGATATSPPAPVPPPPAPPTREELIAAQRALSVMGFETGGADGVIGARSRSALSAFARMEGMPSDIDFGAATLTRLDATSRGFLRLTEASEISPRGTASRALVDTEERYRRGWEAQGSTPPDVAEAAFWFRHAARQGHRQATTALGLLLMRGQAGAPDPVGAAFLWRLAAARGEPSAAFNLGAMFEQGRGVTANLTEARRWYSLAAEAGSGPARDRLRQLGQ